ncbi:GntR family transcriptional regulator [Rhodococcus opacus]|uniref:GntR family transcriptional regulator n=1 Tax=Rhodococcus opacus TaxID=37919 RepID=UPI0022366179|nr:GntR family transcriptional regulator [Rhodococcus opacus]UZG60364.1 GntR family transcriptional regulator [Rhodococcus opacus]
MSSSVERYRRPKTTQEAVLTELRRQILAGELRPGDHIRQDFLATKLSTSRIPLREALSVLAGEGVLTYRAYQGYTVTVLTQTDLVEIQRLLGLLEDEALSHAVRLLDVSTLELLREVADKLDGTGVNQAVQFMDLYEEFRFLLIDAAQMPRLTRLIQLVWQSVDGYRLAWLSDEEARSFTRQTYRQIIDALVERNTDVVIAYMDKHRSYAFSQLAETLLDVGARNK